MVVAKQTGLAAGWTEGFPFLFHFLDQPASQRVGFASRRIRMAASAND
jgi:hypothetical protein